MNLFNSDLIELSMKERSPSNRLHYTSTTICFVNNCTLLSHLKISTSYNCDRDMLTGNNKR